MSICFALIGGDLRNVRLAELLAKEQQTILCYGLEKEKKLKDYTNIKFCDTVGEAIEKSEYILGPIPFSKDDQIVNSPLSENEIVIKEVLPKAQGKTIMAGSFSKKMQELAEEEKVILMDFMKEERLAIMNAIATAEGTIALMIQNIEKNIQDANILILGFGRIGKILARKLEGLSAKVTCTARKQEDLAWIEAYGYRAMETAKINENLSQFDVVINTIPQLILGEKQLHEIDSRSLLIDLASKPGGIDFEKAKEKGIKTLWALGIPGKIAPEASAKYMKEIIDQKIK